MRARLLPLLLGLGLALGCSGGPAEAGPDASLADFGLSDSGASDAGHCSPACGQNQICVHPSWCSGAAIDCSNSPPPICKPVPAGCGTTPQCGCFPADVCYTPNDAGLSGGACISVSGADLECANA
jgi:hypothetical protein